MITTRRIFAETLLTAAGVTPNLLHVGARRFLCAWMHGESGEKPGLCDGVPGHGARWNPLNTTRKLPGSTFYNHLSPTTGVQNYLTREDGARAFILTLNEDARYADFLRLLRKEMVTQRQLGRALDKTPWGTHEPLVTNMIQGYNSDREFFNHYPIGA